MLKRNIRGVLDHGHGGDVTNCVVVVQRNQVATQRVLLVQNKKRRTV